MRTLIHEIRNQLAVATANIEAFLDGKLEPNEKRLNSVLQSLRAIDALLDDVPRGTESPVVMDTAPQPMNICRLLDVTVEGMRAAMVEKSIVLEHHVCGQVHPECDVFLGDAVRIGQIVKNLLLNAVAYTPRGGRIMIDCHREDGGLEILIADSGRGLSEEDVLHLFEPGYRGSAASDVKGSGLGLAVVQRLLRDQGGSITVERREVGTAFRVRFSDFAKACHQCEGCELGH